MDLDDEVESEVEAPAKSVSEEAAEKIDFKFPSNLFPVNPNRKADTDINDEGRAKLCREERVDISELFIAELEHILSSKVQSRKSSLQEPQLSGGPGPYSDLLSVTNIKASSLLIGVVGKALSVDNERKL